MTLVVGSLFSGYGGLDLAIEAALGDVELAWVADIDEGASLILAHRFPTVPNLGDITKVDWTKVRRVDVLSGGFPCQDLSHAGLRKGLRDGTRSGLWTYMLNAVATMRPRLVVFENVRGLLSASADSDVEPCPWCVGGAGDTEPAMRALGSVLADLAGIGYVCRWVGVRASDVGAPHARFRVFGLAWPADGSGWTDAAPDADDSARAANGDPGERVEWEPDRSAAPDAGHDRPSAGDDSGHAPALARLASAPAAPEDPDVAARDERGIAAAGEAESGRARADARGRGRAPSPDAQPLPPVEHGRGRRVARPAGGSAGEDGHEARPGARRRRAVGGGGTTALPGRERPDALDGRGRGRGGDDGAGDVAHADADSRARDDAIGEEAGRKAARRARPRPAADADDDGRDERSDPQGRADAALGTAPDPDRERPQGGDDARGRESDAARRDGGSVTGGRSAPPEAPIAWGPYRAAVERWERVTGRVAPAPTEPSPRLPAWQDLIDLRRSGRHPMPVGRRGPIPPRPAPRLSARFVEWMMGLPDGWVTDVPDLGRNAQLKALGNGVVWQQAAAALVLMLEDGAAAVEAS